MVSPSTAELAFAFQSAKGTPAASSTRRIYLSGGTLPLPQKTLGAERHVRTNRISEGPFAVRVPALGTPEAFARPNMIGALLYAVLGAKAVSGASDPWTHTLTYGTSLPYLTFWTHFAGLLNVRIADTRIRMLTITGRSGQPLRVSFETVSGLPVHRTAQETTAAVETADTLFMEDGRGALKVEGVAVTSISNFTLTIEPGVTLVDTLSGPQPMMDGIGSIRLATDQAIVDATLWQRMIYATSSPSNLAAPSLTPLELAGSPAGIEFMFTEQSSPERSLKLAIPRVALQLEGLNPDPRWKQARMQATYTAFGPAAGATPITATVKNSVSSY